MAWEAFLLFSPIRTKADQYIRHYDALLDAAAAREDHDSAATALLGSDQGRAYLLLDAAMIDAR